MTRKETPARGEERDEPMKALPRETLSQLLGRLTRGPASPIPADEDWPELIERITTPGVVREVVADTWEYFLDVLPPRWMGSGGFAFAEGVEPLRLFWRRAGKFYCRQLSWDETQQLLRLARGGDHVPPR